MPNEENNSPTTQEQNSTKPDHMLPDHVERDNHEFDSANEPVFPDREPATAPEPKLAPAVVFPDVQPAVAGQPPQQPIASHTPNTPGVLILQWLTYAFWGWALVALYWLTSLSIGYFISKTNNDSSSWLYDSNSILAYALAAVIVLFVIALGCDIAYSRFEPRRKTGAATVIMVIHAVIFALCGIGSLIVGVFAFVSTIVGDGDSGAATAMATAAIMTVVYGATLVRTLHPEKIKRITQFYWIVMIVSTLVITSLGIFGPAAYAQRTKSDRALEQALPDIAYAVNEYTREQNKLPASLNDADLERYYSSYDSENTERLIDEGLVTYTAKEQLNNPTATILPLGNGKEMSETLSRLNTSKESDPVYHYQLCATYDAEKNDSGYTYDDRYNNDQRYATSPDTDNHKAGKVCYELQTDYVY